MTLTEFLLARIAEDKARAQGTGKLAWLTFRYSDGSMRYTAAASSGQDPHDAIWVVDGREVTTESNTVQVVYDETRMLAECEAKRRIVKLADCQLDSGGGYDEEAVLADGILRWLALPYADHEEFQQEWRP